MALCQKLNIHLLENVVKLILFNQDTCVVYAKKKNSHSRSSLMVQWVKDPALSLQQLGFDTCHECGQKRKKKKLLKKHVCNKR